jgi:hypothetical protein
MITRRGDDAWAPAAEARGMNTRARTTLALLAAATTAAMAITACGGGGESAADSVQTLEITADKQGDLTVPKSAAPGAAKLTLKNESKGDAEAQLIRIEGDHPREEVLGALGRTISGKPWADFLFAAGGVGLTDPGETLSATQELEAGTTYYVFNAGADGPPQPSDLHRIEVRGKRGAEVRATDATVSATDFEFTADGLRSGRIEVTFENAGREPHHLLLGQLRKGATAADAKQFLLSDVDGKSGPFPPSGGEAATSVLERGTSQVITLDLKPGKYALYCFVSDRQGGPPHIARGMVSEVTVK